MTTDANIIIGIKGDPSGGRVIKRTLDEIEMSSRNVQGSGAQLRNEFSRIDRSARTLAFTMRGLGAALGFRQFQQFTDIWTDLNSRIRIVTGSTEAQVAVMGRLQDMARRTYSSLEMTAESYLRNAFSLQELGYTTQQQLDYTEALNNALVVSGAKAERAESIQNALSKAMAGGNLQGEELNTVLQTGGRVAQALAESLGVSTLELRKLSKEGKLTTDVLFDAMVSQLERFRAEADSMPATIGDAFILLRNSLLESVGDFDQATGAANFLSQAIIKTGDVISVVMNNLAALAQLIKGIFTAIVGSILSMVTEITNGIEKVVNVGVAGLNMFRKDKMSPVDFNGGLTGADIVSAQAEMEAEYYKGARESLLKANASAAKVFGTTTSYQRPTLPNEAPGNRRTPVAALTAEQIKAQKAIDNVTNSLKFQLEQLKRNETEQAVYNNLRSAGVSIDSAAGREIANLTTILEDNSREMERTERIIDSVTGVTEGFFQSWLTGAEGFKGAVKGMIGQLADLAFQMNVIEPIKNNLLGEKGKGGGLLTSVLGAAASGLGNLLGVGGGVTASSFAATQAANVGSGLYGPGFASGGSMVLGGRGGVDRNQLSLNGVPIARVGRGEVLSISPEQKGGGGGVQVFQEINISTGVQETIRVEMLQLLPEIQKSTLAAVNDARARGY